MRHWLLFGLLTCALSLGLACSDTDLSSGDPAPPGAADPGNDDPDLGPSSISGRVIAIDRETGIELSTEEYLERAGLLLVYLLEDPDDLTQVVDKRTLAEPGPWVIDEVEYKGDLHVVVIASDDSPIIGSNSLQRRYPYNPIRVEGRALEDIDVVIDLPSDWTASGGPEPGGEGSSGGSGGGGTGSTGDDDDDGGNTTVPGDDDDDGGNPPGDDDAGGGGDDDDDDDDDDTTPEVVYPDPTTLSGNTVSSSLPDEAIVVTSNSADLSGGPWGYTVLEGFGAFSITVANSHGTTGLMAYHDTDGNGLFEPSDTLGVATANPIQLGEGDVTGITIELPASVPVVPPQPPSFSPIVGQLSFGGYNPSGDILVFATYQTTSGAPYSGVVMNSPGSFGLVCPSDAVDVLVWAVFDANGDGSYDVNVDPFDSFGPVDATSGQLGNVQLDLGGGTAQGSVSGLVSYSGPVTADDVLYISLASEPPVQTTVPELSIVVSNPSFPIMYTFSEVDSGTWWVAAYMDVGGDSPPSSNPGGSSEDIIGTTGVIHVSPGETDTSNNFSLSN
jgi:hypothetical protein